MALKQGDLRALPVLVEIHTRIANRGDPVEAATWKRIGRQIYGIELTGESEPQDSDSAEFDAMATVRARQYTEMYGLQ